MSKRNYPTKTHEILELETNEKFGIKISGFKGSLHYFDEEATLWNADHENILDGYWVVNLINHPENIIRNPQLGEKQTEIFKSLIATGYRWLAKDKDREEYHAYVRRPAIHTHNGVWFSYDGGEADMSHLSVTLRSMFPPSGISDPIDIIQVLTDGGVPFVKETQKEAEARIHAKRINEFLSSEKINSEGIKVYPSL